MEGLLAQNWGRMAVLAAIFALVVIGVLVLNAFVAGRQAVRRRIEASAGQLPDGSAMSLRADATRNAWTRLVDAIERRGLSLSDTNAEGLRARLISAGYSSTYAPRWFTLIRLGMTLGFPLLFITVSLTSNESPSLIKLYFIGSISAVAGLYLPNLWITARSDRRQQKIVNGFPDALDLMLVCVEAGLGIEAAFDRVGREMSISHSLVSEMLGNVVLELRAGRSREESLRRMADRVQVDEIRSFSTLLIQSDKLGSSIGTTLRIYAAEMREKRRMRAEEKAHRLPVLLSIPLVACMLPVMIGVLMLPAGIRVIRQILPVLAGG
ncbi:type II secretion system F family protein [Aquisediminimonas profunda]|uniref:type II secretion system F family protein n=1 Tax=Aquisediminimonas profunda TaxID=1550733 RepID=UPI001C63085A|nr:type II secretion system F family protein [Aquisediminimonas profunda]